MGNKKDTSQLSEMSLSFCYLFVIIDVSNLYVLICANQNRSTQLVLIFLFCF
nr:MAG TPA: hypothetical protein [Caudoviricetes sp.]